MSECVARECAAQLSTLSPEPQVNEAWVREVLGRSDEADAIRIDTGERSPDTSLSITFGENAWGSGVVLFQVRPDTACRMG